jgi:hypothetical protein
MVTQRVPGAKIERGEFMWKDKPLWKYRPLNKFFHNSKNNEEILTFKEIEEILGVTLPAASKKPAFWSGINSSLPHHRAWIEAGWKVIHPTNACKTGRVTFQKLLKHSLHGPPLGTLSQLFDYFKCPYPPYDRNQLIDAYEKMLKQYAPSKLKDMEMGQELIDLAEKKTKEIIEMYIKVESYHFKAYLARRH